MIGYETKSLAEATGLVRLHQPLRVRETLTAPSDQLTPDALPLIIRQHSRIEDDGIEVAVAEHTDASDQPVVVPSRHNMLLFRKPTSKFASIPGAVPSRRQGTALTYAGRGRPCVYHR